MIDALFLAMAGDGLLNLTPEELKALIQKELKEFSERIERRSADSEVEE
jgi:hypothetical protein